MPDNFLVVKDLRALDLGKVIHATNLPSLGLPNELKVYPLEETFTTLPSAEFDFMCAAYIYSFVRVSLVELLAPPQTSPRPP